MSLFGEDFGVNMKMGDAYTICVFTNFNKVTEPSRFYQIFGKNKLHFALSPEYKRIIYDTFLSPPLSQASYVTTPIIEDLNNISHNEWSSDVVWKTITKTAMNNNYVKLFKDITTCAFECVKYEAKFSKYTTPINIYVTLNEKKK